MALLDLIAASDGCGVQDIADRLHLTPPTVSVGVRKLEEAGLVTRTPHSQDKRAVIFFLSDEGRGVQARSQDFRRKKMETILAGLEPEEQTEFLRLLEKAIQAAEAKNITGNMEKSS
jgi:DNA-binding MarR family transcriptional regulator